MDETTSDSSHISLESSDALEAAQGIARVFSPHVLQQLDAASALLVRVDAWSGADVTVADIAHGAAVRVVPERLDSYYAVNTPLSGAAVTRLQDQQVQSTTHRGVVLDPLAAIDMTWSADCRQVSVRLPRALVERTLHAAVGHAPSATIRFALPFELQGEGGRQWMQAVAAFRDAIRTHAHPIVLRPLAEALAARLITSQPHNYSDEIANGRAPARTRSIARVIDAIEANPDLPMTSSDLALIAQTSVRSMQAAFAEHIGTTPIAYLRQVRLARARQDFLSAPPGTTVSEIASRWGFTHLPRFAAAYRDRFGTLPSQDLRGG